MSFTEWISEQIYILFSTYYYEVFYYKGNVLVGRYIQSIKTHSDFIIDYGRKKAFLIDKSVIKIKGHKMMLHYDFDTGIPLETVIQESITEVTKNVTKVKKEEKLVAKTTKKQISQSKAFALNEKIPSPDLLFKILDSEMVKQVLSKPKTTDWFMVVVVIVAAILILGFMVTMVFGLKV